VTVVCSRYENFGYAVLEGLSFGCPMVVSRTGGLVEMVEHERSALMCEPGDAGSLAAQIDRMLGDRPLAERLAAQGLRNVQERYSPAVIAERTIALYRRVLGMKTDYESSFHRVIPVPLIRDPVGAAGGGRER
jgi:glycosyltransferase involved in cell wall biosynthesis